MALAMQMKEKQMKQQNDIKANRIYMNQMVERAENDRKKQSNLDDQRKQKVMANQKFLIDQMLSSGSPIAAVSKTINSSVAQEMKSRKKAQLGGMMNPDEARMNRALLQEIGRIKRGESPTNMLSGQLHNPI